METFDIVVIGGGPAGMMAAGRAAELGAKVVLLEKNPGLGKKLLISGGGRCNILNAEYDTRLLAEKYGRKGKTLFSVFAQFDVTATEEFFTSRGLPLIVEAEKRAFPVTEKAEDVQKTMVKYLKQGKVEVILGARVRGFEMKDDSIAGVLLDRGKTIRGRNYILATGGKSHPETGSTGDGFPWLQSLGHAVTEPDPALVPVTLGDPWIFSVAGISLKGVRLRVEQSGTKHDSRIGKMLFTHEGLSGPLVLNMSKQIGQLLKTGPVMLSLDLFPALDPGAMDRRLLEVFAEGKNKMIKNNIGGITQPRLGHALLKLAGIDSDLPLHQLPREKRLAFGKLLKDIPLHVSGLLGAEDAVVTGGGVDLREVEFKTMRSKKCRNLYLAGDILDFDRPSGGFSLQICWTTGFVAGSSAAASAIE